MTSLPGNRVESLDLLKGLVMVFMALDHTRDYFHASAFLFDPTDPTQSTLIIFFTRWITHFCAPVFCFLAGISALLVGQRKTTRELSSFLIKRGIWLIFIDFTLINFAWYFDCHFASPGLMVIWCLAVSMMVLAALIHLPKTAILIFGLILIFGHNLLDNVHFSGNILWSVIHETGMFRFPGGSRLYIAYPLIPWIAVMALGYYFGSFYQKTTDPQKRQRIFNIIGISAVSLYFMIRLTNSYGDPVKWNVLDTPSKTVMSFLNISKYPPSLLYLLITLGGAFLFLANSENLKGKISGFFTTFGRVPFFYYVVHLYLLHLIALLFAQLSGWGWKSMILSDWVTELPQLKGYGFELWVVYLVWIAIIAALWPLCKRFDHYKLTHKGKWWLSYV